MNLANEGLEARKKDEEVATKKRKAEEEKAWEGVFLHSNSDSQSHPTIQTRGNSAWIAGVSSLHMQRKRRRPRTLYLDESSSFLSVDRVYILLMWCVNLDVLA